MKKLGQILLFFFSIGVALYAMVTYWGFDVTGILFSKNEELLSDTIFRLSFYGHVFFGPIALLTGPFQFMPKFRNNKMKWHRALGIIYIVACLIGGVAGLSAAQFASGSPMNVWGFSFLAISWLITTTYAWTAIMKKDIEGHQKWMLRSFALTLAAVTLRLQLGIYQALFGMTFFEAYNIVAWSCWVPNLIFIEWFIRKRLNSNMIITT